MNEEIFVFVPADFPFGLCGREGEVIGVFLFSKSELELLDSESAESDFAESEPNSFSKSKIDASFSSNESSDAQEFNEKTKAKEEKMIKNGIKTNFEVNFIDKL